MNIKYLLISILTLTSMSLSAKEIYSDTESIEMDVDSYDQILLFNKNGNVKVTGIQGTKAYIKVIRSLETKTGEEMEKAKKEIYLDTMNLQNNLYFFIQNPYQILEIEEVGEGAYYNSRDNGKWRWSNHNHNGVKYSFKLEVQLPMNKALRVSTHKEDLTVKGMKGRLNAAAHFGKIRLEGVRNAESVMGHHGDIFVNFDTNPTVNGEYHTHHGKIELEFPNSPSANVSMSSYHGKFYTDFDWSPNPQMISKEKNKKGLKYRIGTNTSVKLGDGDYNMSLKTHHGDLYILKA